MQTESAMPTVTDLIKLLDRKKSGRTVTTKKEYLQMQLLVQYLRSRAGYNYMGEIRETCLNWCVNYIIIIQGTRIFGIIILLRAPHGRPRQLR